MVIISLCKVLRTGAQLMLVVIVNVRQVGR